MMDTTELEAKIKEILAIVEKVPEKFQEKCFEVLLSSSLTTVSSVTQMRKEKKKEDEEIAPIPIDVKAFLQQYNLPKEKLDKLFLIQGTEVRVIYEIKTARKSNAQIQIATLTALENALKDKKFKFGMEDVRQKCKDQRCYDGANFKAHFKNNAIMFKSLTDEEAIELSPDGKAELAETILEITK